jgi:hypothetical protein
MNDINELILLTSIDRKLSDIVDVLHKKNKDELETENLDSDSNIQVLLEE